MLVGYPVYFVTEFADNSDMLLNLRANGCDDKEISLMCQEILTKTLEETVFPEMNDGWTQARVMTMPQALRNMSYDESENYLKKWGLLDDEA